MNMLPDYAPCVPPPVGSWFASNLDYEVLKLPDGTFGISKTFESYWGDTTRGIQITNVFIDSNNGDDVTGDGLSFETAWSTINKLSSDVNYTGASAVIVHLRGVFDRSSNDGTKFNRSEPVRVIGYDGARITTSMACSDYTWTQQAGPNNSVWRATVSSPDTGDGIVDETTRNRWGDFSIYDSVSSVVACQATPESFYVSGSSFYMNSTVDPSTTPLRIMAKHVGILMKVTGYSLFLENIEMSSNSSSPPIVLQGDGSSNFFGSGVFLHTNRGSNLFSASKTSADYKIRLWDCIASNGYSDGFSYHTAGTIDALEVRCIGRNNGQAKLAEGPNNGSTIHDGGKIVRLSCQYYGNWNRNVHDISDNTESWHVGCVSGDTQTSSVSKTQQIDYAIGFDSLGDSTKAWFDRCSQFGNSANPFYVGASANVYIKNSSFGVDDFISGGGGGHASTYV